MFIEQKKRMYSRVFTGLLLYILDDGSSDSDSPDRQQATALLMAGRHLPEPMIASKTDRVHLISEASKIYEAIGDKKSVQSCRKVIMQFEDSSIPSSLPVQC